MPGTHIVRGQFPEGTKKGQICLQVKHRSSTNEKGWLIEAAFSILVSIQLSHLIEWPKEQREASNIRHEDFRSSLVTLRVPPLDSETGWTGELWSNPVLLILEN